MRKNSSRYNLQAGITIVEMLIVVIVLAILALLIFIYLNPHDFTKKAKDAERKELIATLGKAITTSQTALGGKFPPVSTPKTWHATLIEQGELRSMPKTQLPAALPCTTAGGYTALANQGFCYKANAARDQYVVYTLLISDSERKKTHKCATKSNYNMFYFISNTSNEAGFVCLKNNKQPTPATNINTEDIDD